MNDKILELLQEIKSNMATKEDIERIEKKVDIIMEQVAHNTENASKLNELAATVESHGTDIKLLKKLVANR